MAFLISIVAVFLVALGITWFVNQSYRQAKNNTSDDEWWAACIDVLGLPADVADGAHRAEYTIDGQTCRIEQHRGGRSATDRNTHLKLHYVITFEPLHLPFDMVDHLDTNDPVGLRSGMPSLDQQTVFRTDEPIATLHTLAYEGVSGKLYRVMHLNDAWRWEDNRLILKPEFTKFDQPGISSDVDGPEEGAERIRELIEQAGDIYNQLQAATDNRDAYWRPRTDAASAWKSVASDHDFEFACSQSPYEDAAIEGEWHGRRLMMHSMGKADRPASETRLTLDVPDLPLDIDFTLLGAPAACTERDELLADIADGSHDLSTDDDSSGFERIFDIQGDRITTYGHLGRPGVEPALLKLYRPDIEIVVEPAVIEVRLPGVPRTESELTRLLEDVELLADSLVGDVTDMDVLDETTATQDSSAADWT
jgi:hypothetical protein